MKTEQRQLFETWAGNQPYFGYTEGDPMLLDRDEDGYSDACVHAAWMGYCQHSTDHICIPWSDKKRDSAIANLRSMLGLEEEL